MVTHNGILFKELVKGERDIFGRIHKGTGKGYKKLTWESLHNFWYDHPLSHHLNFSYLDTEVKDNGYDGYGCMACGHSRPFLFRRDRAHILAHSSQGSCQPNNLHSLCLTCHQESENYSGLLYWAWIANKSQLYRHGFFMSVEQDLSLDKTGDYVYYDDPSTFEEKIKTKSRILMYYIRIKEGFFKHQDAIPHDLDMLEALFPLVSPLSVEDIQHILDIDEYSMYLYKGRLITRGTTKQFLRKRVD